MLQNSTEVLELDLATFAEQMRALLITGNTTRRQPSLLSSSSSSLSICRFLFLPLEPFFVFSF